MPALQEEYPQTLAQQLGMIRSGLVLNSEAADALNRLLNAAVWKGGESYKAAVKFSREVALAEGARFVLPTHAATREEIAGFQALLEARLQEAEFNRAKSPEPSVNDPYHFDALQFLDALGLSRESLRRGMRQER